MGMKGKENSSTVMSDTSEGNANSSSRPEENQPPNIVVDSDDSSSSTASSTPTHTPATPQTPQHGLVAGFRCNSHHEGRPNSAPPYRLERMVHIVNTVLGNECIRPDQTGQREPQAMGDHEYEEMLRAGTLLRSMGDQCNVHVSTSTLARSLRSIGDHYDFECTVRRTLSYGDLGRVAPDPDLIRHGDRR